MLPFHAIKAHPSLRIQYTQASSDPTVHKHFRRHRHYKAKHHHRRGAAEDQGVRQSSKTKKVVATPPGHHHHLDVKEAIVEVDTVSRTGVRHHEAHASIEVEDVNKCTGEVRAARRPTCSR